MGFLHKFFMKTVVESKRIFKHEMFPSDDPRLEILDGVIRTNFPRSMVPDEMRVATNPIILVHVDTGEQIYEGNDGENELKFRAVKMNRMRLFDDHVDCPRLMGKAREELIKRAFEVMRTKGTKRFLNYVYSIIENGQSVDVRGAFVEK